MARASGPHAAAVPRGSRGGPVGERQRRDAVLGLGQPVGLLTFVTDRVVKTDGCMGKARSKCRMGGGGKRTMIR